ncbi:hypothetical protein AX15_007321 [Amanita polypyramis BW_CC]|nr:hypothetical protein AX15_007321 [Amanita polypyramis BW_CC]
MTHKDQEARVKRRRQRGASGLADLCSNYSEGTIHKAQPRVHSLSVPSFRSALPTELLDLIFSRISYSELLCLARTNTTFYAIATRLLYQDLTSLSIRQSIHCLLALARNTSLPPLVRSLELNWQSLRPSRNLYHLLHTVLKSLASLKSLYLDLPKHHSPTWVLDGCTFSLRQLTTSLHCKAPLARFLECQPEIVELTLRGFQNNCSSMNPLHIFSSDLGIRPLLTDFELKPGSLPSLSIFNTVHAGPPIIRTIASGRSVWAVSVPLFPQHTMATLDVLSLASSSIRRLSLISFDPDAPTFLFAQLVERFPWLEVLHVVMLMSKCNLVLLNSTAAHLAKFKSLQYITFMATMDSDEDVDERNVAKRWHAACPTLRTIILPGGKNTNPGHNAVVVDEKVVCG